ncbi:MAG: c-type cytochrome [Acetobacterales bacterium]
MSRSGGTTLIALLIVVLLGGAGYFLFFAGSFGAGARSSADPDDGRLVAEGQQVYIQYCASCHGRDLEGQRNWRTPLSSGVLPAPPHDETGHTWHHADEVLFEYTKFGGRRFVGESGKSGMPGFGALLDDHRIWAAIAYIKSTWPAEIRKHQARLGAQER